MDREWLGKARKMKEVAGSSQIKIVRRKASWTRMERYKNDALLKAGFMAEKGKCWLGRGSPLASVTNYAKRVEAWLKSGRKLKTESTTGWTSVDEQTQGKMVHKLIISAKGEREAKEFAANEEDVFEVRGKASKDCSFTRSWLLAGSWDFELGMISSEGGWPLLVAGWLVYAGWLVDGCWCGWWLDGAWWLNAGVWSLVVEIKGSSEDGQHGGSRCQEAGRRMRVARCRYCLRVVRQEWPGNWKK